MQGIRFVIDSCFVKLNFFDVRSGVDALVVCPVSRAAATQRAGKHASLFGMHFSTRKTSVAVQEEQVEQKMGNAFDWPQKVSSEVTRSKVFNTENVCGLYT